jgi:hypothetical protein
MTVDYRGFEINVVKDRCLAGYDLTYFSIFRKSDGYEIASGNSDDADTASTWVGMMESRVDGFIADPSEEVLEGNLRGEEYAQAIERHRQENQKTERLHG